MPDQSQAAAHAILLPSTYQRSREWLLAQEWALFDVDTLLNIILLYSIRVGVHKGGREKKRGFRFAHASRHSAMHLVELKAAIGRQEKTGCFTLLFVTQPIEFPFISNSCI